MNFTKESIFLFLFQVLAHLSLIYGIFFFSLSAWLVVFFVYFLTGCIGVSITYHRFLSHRSFHSPRWFEILGTLLASYGLVGSSLAWVNNHRSHHRHVDKIGDPHSPTVYGALKVQWLSMFTSEKSFRYIRQYLKDNFHLITHKYYFYIHLVLLILLILTVGWYVTAMIYLAPAAVLWNAGSLINTVCHLRYGYRNHNLPDNSSNNIFLGYFVWGEGWHNNHHHSPANSKFGQKWWEFDISYYILSIFNKSRKT